METPEQSRTAAPAVVAVVVTRNPGPWFENCLEALAAQDYPNLAVLFLDAASDADPTPQIASVLPDAYVRALDENRGYGWAANHAATVVDGAAFFCFLHDDAAPEPDAISTMVGEALRSNAGIVGAKLVQIDDHRRLLQVGETIDKTGERLPAVEPGELDQEQHDAVRDVFVVPSGCMLVRADLFGALGGFDEEIDLLNDDLNLCWRAHVAGARVLVAPDAVVGHVEALGDRQPADERRHRLIRHRLRTMLVCYSPAHLLRVLPQAAIVAFFEVVYSVLAGRRGQASDVIGAWRWNWDRRDQIRARRAFVAAHRGVPDAEIRNLQTRGSARLTRFLRGQTARGGTRADRASAIVSDTVVRVRSGELRWPIVAWMLSIAVLAFGTRHLLFGPIPAVGGFVPFDLGPRELLDQFLSGWRPIGLGSSSQAPTAYGLLAALGALFLGAMGALRSILFLGGVVLGILGMGRLLRPMGSPRSRAVALVGYGAAPIAYDAISHARWGALVVYGATPWIFSHLARAAGWAPFGPVGGTPGPSVRATTPGGRIVSLGLLLAFVGAVEPAVWPLTIVVGLGLVIGAAVSATGAGSAALLGTGLGAVGVSMALHAPWLLELAFVDDPWEALVGVRGAEPEWSFAELLRFDVGPIGGGPLLAGFAVAAALPLLIGREWRFDWAVRAWTLTLSLVGLTWAGAHGWLPVEMPPAETMLAPAAAALALSAGLGVAAFESDLRAYGFGWRQIVAAGAAVAFALSTVPTALDAVNGRWKLSGGDLATTFAFLDDQDPGARTLWIGDPDVLPLPGFRLDAGESDHVVYATSQGGLPGITNAWAGAADGPTPRIEEALRAAVAGDTSRLGRLLAPMSIRYLVLPDAMAPEPLGGVRRPRPSAVVEALAHQLDLAVVAVNPAYLVYRNDAALPARSIVPAGAETAPEVTGEIVENSLPVLEDAVGATTARGQVAAGATVLVSAAANDNWELIVEGRPQPRITLFGWAQGFQLTVGGDAVVRYDTSPIRYAVLALQAAFWAMAIGAARRSRRASRRRSGLDDGPSPVGTATVAEVDG